MLIGAASTASASLANILLIHRLSLSFKCELFSTDGTLHSKVAFNFSKTAKLIILFTTQKKTYNIEFFNVRHGDMDFIHYVYIGRGGGFTLRCVLQR